MSGEKTPAVASSLLTSMQKRSFELAANDEISDNEVGGAASFGRFRIERRNSKQQNGKFILNEGVIKIFLKFNSFLSSFSRKIFSVS